MCGSVLLLYPFTYFFLLFICVMYFSLTLVACMCVKSALYYYYSTLYHHSQHHSVKVLAFWQNIKTKKIFFRSTLSVSHTLYFLNAHLFGFSSVTAENLKRDRSSQCLKLFSHSVQSVCLPALSSCWHGAVAILYELLLLLIFFANKSTVYLPILLF